MARDVNIILGKIIAEQRGISETQGEEIVKRLRSSNLYQALHPVNQSFKITVANLLIGGCLVIDSTRGIWWWMSFVLTYRKP